MSEPQDVMAIAGEPVRRVIRETWGKVAGRVIASVEAPDYDTRVNSLLRPILLVELVVLLGVALAMLFTIWWVGATYGWVFFVMLWLMYALALVGIYKSDIRRTAGQDPSLDSDEALIVRAPAIAGDATLAPLAETQPTVADTGDGLPTSRRMPGLYRPQGLIPPDDARVRNRIPLALFGIILFMGFFFLLTQTTSLPPYGWVIAVEGVVFVIQLLGSIMLRVWARQPMRVVADARGVTWRRAGRRRSLAWSAAQALCFIDVPPSRPLPASVTQRIYWLQGADGAFTWASRPYPWRRSKRTRANGSEGSPIDGSYDAEAWRFCALAASHTGLPLRDMTATMNAMTLRWPKIAAMRDSLSASSSAQRSATEQSRFTTLRAARRRRTRVVFGVLTTLGALILVPALTLGIGAPLAYGDLLRGAEGQAPLFADSLANPSGEWPVSVSPDAPFAYIGGAYTTIADGPCCDLVALASTPRVRDGVVEVTVHQVSDFDLASAGIILRANPTTHRALIFAFSPDGEWTLKRYTLSADGQNALEGATLISAGILIPEGAIHRGSDTVNRLAVIMRGASYAFFINGQYVGMYHDTQDTGARVGLYADGLGDTTSFTNFAIYPAPPASPLFPV